MKKNIQVLGRFLLSFLFVFFIGLPQKTLAQAAPEQYQGVMLQAFYWNSHQDSKWTNMESKADEIASSFSLVWLPPSGNDMQVNHMGYHPVYYFDQNSSFGTQTELKSLIGALKAKGCGAIADIVVNHRNGVSNWTNFPAETYKGITYTWGPEAICSDDEVASEPGQQKPTGAPDTGDGWVGARDIDHTNQNVRNTIKAYLDFMKNEMGYVGWRWDVAKGFYAWYMGEYAMSAGTEFSVGEYWDQSYDKLTEYIDKTKIDNQIRTGAFDFSLQKALQDALNNNDGSPTDFSKLCWKKYGSIDQPAGLIHMDGFKRFAYTFVDNHDTYGKYDEIKKNVLAANAYIIAHPGIPCVFYKHWLAHKVDIQKMITARNLAGVHSQSDVRVIETNQNVYFAEITGKKGSLLVKVGTQYNVNVPTGYTLNTFGENYAIWTKLDEPLPAELNLSVSPDSGTFDKSVDVTLSVTGGAEPVSIYYTIDGTQPTASSAKVDSGHILNIAQTATLKVIAIDKNGVQTSVISKNYEMSNLPTDTVEFVDVELPSIISGSYVSTTGRFTNHTGWQRTDYISLADHSEMLFSVKISGGTVVSVVSYYDSNKNFISSGLFGNPSNAITNYVDEALTLPQGAAYVIFSHNATSALSLKAKKAVVDPNPNPGTFVDVKPSIISGSYVDTVGKFTANAGWQRTDYVSLSGYSDMTFSVTITGGTVVSVVSYYDSNKNFISSGLLGNKLGATANYVDETLTLPQGAAYVIFSYNATSVLSLKAKTVVVDPNPGTLVDVKPSIISGSYVDTVGKFTANAGWQRTDYVSLSGYSDMTFSVTITGGTVVSVVSYYDSNKNFISSGLLGNKLGATVNYVDEALTLPQGAAYVIFSYNATSVLSLKAKTVVVDPNPGTLVDVKPSIISGSYVDTVGKFTANAGWQRTDYVSLSGYSDMTFSVTITGGTVVSVVSYYDSNKNFISSGLLGNKLGATVNYADEALTLPQGAAYVIFSYNATSVLSLKAKIVTVDPNPDPDPDTLVDVEIPSIISGNYVSTTGKFTANAGWQRTDYVSLSDYSDMEFSVTITGGSVVSVVSYYDSNKNFISSGQLGNTSGATVNYVDKALTLPEGAAYVIFSYNATSVLSLKAKKVQTEPEPEIKKITVRWENTQNWPGNMYIYAWGIDGKEILGTWPGKLVAKEADGTYSHVFEDKDIVNIVLSNGSIQTVDIVNIINNSSYVITSEKPDGKKHQVSMTMISPTPKVTKALYEDTDNALFIEKVEVYPNPATDILYVKGDIDQIEEAMVLSMNGALMLKVTDVSYGINISNLSNGLYILSLKKTNGERSFVKFIKK